MWTATIGGVERRGDGRVYVIVDYNSPTETVRKEYEVSDNHGDGWLADTVSTECERRERLDGFVTRLPEKGTVIRRRDPLPVQPDPPRD